MPKRKDIKKILVVGAGPIIIGQACEFDYSGTQACKALKDEGFKVILINSNPATIMTDPNVADKTYIEPITIEVLEKILIKEKPDAILPTMGGQTALNLAMEAEKKGILKKYKIELIGANSKAISNAEDRKKFRKNMIEIGLDLPKSKIVNNFKQSSKVLKQIGLPAIIRPAFTLGGLGGGIAKNKKDFYKIIKNGLHESPVNQVLVEECLEGWKEFEMEVVRDKNDNCIIICSIENLDPMGIHTGDSVTIAPALTLTDKEYQVMRNASIACLRKIGVETGGSNVQFAINPKNGRMVIIEMNPRVSRSSALASKATGFPIAKIAAKLAVGYTLDELKNEITKVTPASFEPTIDYVVTKIPRFTFEKFSSSAAVLGTSMKSVGEAMAIGRNFKESFQKALSVQKIHPDRPIIAADTLIVMPDQTLAGTPTSSEQAGQMIRKMLNTAHWVVTGVTLLLPEIQGQTPENKRIQFADRAQVTLGNVSNSDLDAYLDTGNWQGKAGGYNLFDRQAAGWPVTVNGDQTTVVGLPMAILMQHLKDM